MKSPESALAYALSKRPSFPWREYVLYAIFHLVASPFLALNGWRRARKRGYGKGMWRRLAGGDKPPKQNRRNVVILAGGLGEVRVAARMASLIRGEGLGDPTILTRADDAFAADPGGAFLGRGPFNNPLSAGLFLLRWRPKALLTIEFADNHHLKALARLNRIPQLVLNVPITEDEKDRVLAKRADLWRWLPTDAYLCGTEAARDRLVEIGIPAHRAIAAGPFALAPDPGPDPETTRREIRAALKLVPEDAPILLAGSTYPPEEGVILAAFAELRRDRPNAVLIVAPRRLDRAEGVAIPGAARRSEGYTELPPSRVIILDTYGELGRTYSVADLALVGGTYGVDLGGHTPMEAVAWNVPVLVGPSHAQQAALVESLTESKVAWIWQNPEELTVLMKERTDHQVLRESRNALATRDDESDALFLRLYRVLAKVIQLSN